MIGLKRRLKEKANIDKDGWIYYGMFIIDRHELYKIDR